MTVVGSENPALARSRRFCEQLTRQAAKNFYYGLKLLPEPKRSAMFAIYAYMRLVDDIADDDEAHSLEGRIGDLEKWRLRTHEVLQGNVAYDGQQLWPAFADVVRRCRLPH